MFRNLVLSILMLTGLTAFGTTSTFANEQQSTLASQGTFEGLSNHVTSGGVSILKTENGYVAVLEADFSLDGAPDPTLGFGNNGTFDTDTIFTKLENINGLQAYAIPANIDVSSFSEFYVWCAEFSVPLGVAALTR